MTALLCVSMIACSNDPAATGGTGTADTGKIETATGTAPVTPTEEIELLEIPEEAFYENYEFRVLGLSFGDYTSRDIIAEELSEDPLNDAVYERNNMLKEKLGINIVSQNETTGNILTVIKANVQAETDAWDLCVPQMKDAIALARENCLYNLYDVPYIDMTKSWWDQNVPQTMTIKDKLFFTTGDISFLDDDLTSVHIFNKEVLAEKVPDLDVYQMVKDYKWTWDAMEQVIKDLNDDLNGDGKADKDDFWGMCLSTADIATYYVSSGEKMVGPDGNGGFAFAMDGTRAMEVATKGFDFMLDNQFFRTDTLQATAQDELDAFMEGRLGFRSTIFSVARKLRPMEMDFGMLPIPLFDEDQDRYYTPVSYAMIGFCIPKSVSDIERTGVITEAMAYYSKQYLTPAFYDVSVDGLLTRDDESKEMLDILFGSKVYDIGYLCNFGGLQRMLRSVVEADSKAFASKYDSVRDSINNEVASVVEQFEF